MLRCACLIWTAVTSASTMTAERGAHRGDLRHLAKVRSSTGVSPPITNRRAGQRPASRGVAAPPCCRNRAGAAIPAQPRPPLRGRRHQVTLGTKEQVRHPALDLNAHLGRSRRPHSGLGLRQTPVTRGAATTASSQLTAQSGTAPTRSRCPQSQRVWIEKTARLRPRTTSRAEQRQLVAKAATTSVGVRGRRQKHHGDSEQASQPPRGTESMTL